MYQQLFYEVSILLYLLYNRLMSNHSHELCSQCVGACCRGPIIFELERREYDFMRESGTDLRLVATHENSLHMWVDVPPCDPAIQKETSTIRMLKRTVRQGKAILMLIGTCGNLDPDTYKCNEYTNPAKPSGCSFFVMGSTTCRELRANRIEEIKVSLTSREMLDTIN